MRMREQSNSGTNIEKLLRANTHMAGMERLEMVIEDIQYPFAHVARLQGRISPNEPLLWARPNIALRLEVDGGTSAQRPLTRVYTVRHFDPKTNLLEIDFVIHD